MIRVILNERGIIRTGPIQTNLARPIPAPVVGTQLSPISIPADLMEFIYRIEERHETLVITAEGQNEMTLLGLPTHPQFSKLFLNGNKQIYGLNYTIQAKTLTWLEQEYILNVSDILEIYYY